MRLYIFALIVFSAVSARAQDASVPDNKPKPTKVAQATDLRDIDAEITNAKLRAESGSKSEWSIKADINYNGGNLETPFGPIRPNYAGISSQDNSTSIAGTIAVAYRLTAHDSLRAGTGVLILTPFHNSWEEVTNSNGSRKTDISNPYLEYSRSMKLGGWQNIFDTSYTQITQSAYTNAHYVGTFDVNHTALYKITDTEWEVGGNIDFNYTFFNDDKQPTDTLTNPESGRSDYTIALYPYAEYAFNERYSFRTVFRFLTFDHYRYDDPSTYFRELYTQSVGLGIAVTRDVYLYPNIQFAPEHLSPERTNVGLNTTINIF
ncbi:MAG: hypothetical protein JSU04_00620 [Bdellovibrionales bacterium]|nr:hypothetical protein [Bdellovibrionales bacterium]